MGSSVCYEQAFFTDQSTYVPAYA